MSKTNRRRYTAEEKVSMLREHLVENDTVSDVCDRHQLNPTVFYRWQQEFFENGAAAFDRQSGKKADVEKRKLQALQVKLQQKDSVISEIMEALIIEKKRPGAH